MEGHDLCGEELAVVICNGFVGNIVLKTCEGLALHMMSGQLFYKLIIECRQVIPNA